MNRAILIVGPAGIGKTSASRAAAAVSNDCSAVVLDRIAADHWSKQGAIPRSDFQLLVRSLWPSLRLLAAGLDALREFAAESPDRILLVELSSTFQEIPSAVDLWRTFDVVALTASPEAAYQRFVMHSDKRTSFDEYAKREFNPDRRRVYDSAQHQIDVSRISPELAAEQLASVIRVPSRGTEAPGLLGPSRPRFAGS